MRTFRASFIYIMMSAVTSLSYSMLLTVELVYLTKMVGFDALQLVLIGTVRQTICLLFQIPTGILADMYSRRWSVILGMFLLGAGYFIEGAFPVAIVVFAAQPLWGLGVTLMDGADTAWIADELGTEAAAAIYLRGSQIGSLASLLGIAASVVLVNIRLNLPVVVGASLLILLSVVLVVVMPEKHFTPAPRDGRGTWQQMGHTLRIGARLVRSRPVLLTILSIAVFSGTFSAGFDQLWQYSLLHRFTFPSLAGLTSVTWFCVIEAGISLTNFCGTAIVRRLVDTTSHRAVTIALFMGDFLTVVGVIGFALFSQFALAMAAFFLFTMARGPQISLERVWMNQHLESNVRATLFSLRGQISAVAQIVGGLLLGVVATMVGTSVALVAAGLVLLPSLGLYVWTMNTVSLP
jgi:DHA3 family tetracycline resistance protein-like MFS transporter